MYKRQAQDIIKVFERRMPSGGTVHIEEIQDQVELQLMRNEHHKVARTYVLYREARKNERVEEEKPVEVAGNIEDVINAAVEKACHGLENVDEVSLAKGITLIESEKKSDLKYKIELLNYLKSVNNTMRIGVTGPPGVGKSTFICLLYTSDAADD